jgi:hypothetical protein
MAAATLLTLAPTILSALPVIVPFIKDQIVQIESLFGGKTAAAPNVGQTKLNTVVNNVVGLVNNLANLPDGAPNKLAGPLDPTSIATIVETLVQQLKAQPGGLTPEKATMIVQAQATGAPTPAAPAATPVLMGRTFTGTFTVSG